MGDKLLTGIVAVVTAIIGVAIIALLVSNNAQTGSVIKAGGGAFSQVLRCALSPVTGGGCGNVISSTISYGGITG